MSFLEELEKLAQPAPALPDVEDEGIDGSSSVIRLSEKYDELDIEEGQKQSRRRIIGIEMNDEKYRGEKTSRKEMFGDSSEFLGISNVAHSEDESENEEEDEERNAEVEESESDGGSENGSIRDSELEGSEDDTVEKSESSSDDENVDAEETQTTMKNLVGDTDISKEAKKGVSIRNQQSIWDQLLFVHIKLHSALRSYNQLPRGHLLKELLADADEKTRDAYQTAKTNSVALINGLLEVETRLLASCSTTKSIVGLSGGAADSDDDEEIESSEDEKEDDESPEKVEDEEDAEELDSDDLRSDNRLSTDSSSQLPKKLSMKDAAKTLHEMDGKYDKFRSATLRKWYERTRLSAPSKNRKADFSAFDNDIMQQLEKVLADKQRVYKRTQTKRTDFERIGGDGEADEDDEIYDDDDFYQVLLNELISKRTNKASDPVAMTRHYIEMQKLKQKRSKKRAFDGRLSKLVQERKIKFIQIPKLVNFHPSRPETVEWTHEQRNELFKSLFR